MNIQKLLIIFCGLIVMSSGIKAMSLSDKVEMEKANDRHFVVKELFSHSVSPNNENREQVGIPQNFSFDKNAQAFEEIIKEKPLRMEFAIPFFEDKEVATSVLKSKVHSENSKLITASGDTTSLENGVHYRGTGYIDIDGEEKKFLVALSFFEDEMRGMLLGTDNNYTIARPLDASQYTIFNEDDFEIDQEFECRIKEKAMQSTPDAPNYSAGSDDESSNSCQLVEIFFEADYDTYNQFGTTQEVADYTEGFFNVVALIYENQGLNIQISDILVWDQPDPYEHIDDRSDILGKFADERTSFDGDLAHFISTRSDIGGGIAYLSALCNSSRRYAVSGISTFYEEYPTYSWTIFVVSHELGHNFSSPHTHWCGWPDGPIDNCTEVDDGPCDEGPTPEDGTIMSYCHLEPSVGINFQVGLHQYPLQVMTDHIDNAACIDEIPEPQPEITPETDLDICEAPEEGVKLTVGDYLNTQYQWKRNDEPIGDANEQELITSQPGKYSVEMFNDCFSVDSEEIFVTADQLSGFEVQANSPLCSGQDLVFNVENFPEGAQATWKGPGFEAQGSSAILEGANQGSAGIYTLTLEAENCRIQQDLNIEVAPNPLRPSIEEKADTLKVFSPDENFTYKWFRNGNLMEDVTGHWHIPEKDGFYSVQRYLNPHCNRTSDPVNVQWTSLSDYQNLQDQLKVYPNPSGLGIFTIEHDGFQDTEVHLSVVDLQGRELYSRTINTGKSLNYELKIPEAETGNYILKLQSDKHNVVRKLQIQ